jgi:hypothetical protein
MNNEKGKITQAFNRLLFASRREAHLGQIMRSLINPGAMLAMVRSPVLTALTTRVVDLDSATIGTTRRPRKWSRTAGEYIFRRLVVTSSISGSPT